MAQYTLPYIKTPLFIVQSLSDAWQAVAILDLSTWSEFNDPVLTKSEISYLNQFRRMMLESYLGTYLAKPDAGIVVF